jgi:tRNA(Ile)-lysidine synthase
MQKFSLETYKKSKTKNEELFDMQSIDMPVTVRGRKAGDKISPLGTNGHKKLKDIFIDKKISVKERDAIPIVVMKNQPIWAIGICIDNKVKVTTNTRKLLKLTFYRN